MVAIAQAFFTVVIPVHNRASIIGGAIDSVLNQTIDDYEIVIVDDGSTDDIAGIVARYSDPRIRLLRQQKRGGSAARNLGVDAATGRYIAFLDSDDQFLPHHLATMRQIVAGHGDVVGFSQVIVDRRNGKAFLKPPAAPTKGQAMADYLCCARGFVQTSTLVVPVALAKSVRYRVGMPFGQDTDFAIRLSLAGARFKMAEHPGAIWNDAFDPARVSAQRKGVANLGWIDEMRPLISERAYHGYRGWHIAKGIAKKDKWRALGMFFTAVRHRCYSLGLASVIFCQILMPDRIYHKLADLVIRVTGIDKQRIIEGVGL